ncbi:TadE/TadG family type IV pilus assembly protein [Sphingomicrobium aestuariivivum]|uniref:TadE/TadG family type IV pilus assembly protein n=1 Tax=Sphingomicrobium aestuariivivum TaxID=1582356 RepID=UPI001FD65178|nr:TadE/TadG family type IV pilus assembly protein [Sphingomicrobium aestuariivivum]MCJ8191043.1 pilus assembly protein [Sphingomicrobium aestuariivivum]
MRNALRLDVRALAQDQRGASAVEMALMVPLLLLLMFGTFEIGNYFSSVHQAQKGVRDAARYAGRLPYDDITAGACTYDTASTAHDQIRNLARTGTIDGTGEPRINYWTDNATVTVTMSCDVSGTYTGSFSQNVDGAPRVNVSAVVPYESLFGLPWIDSVLDINASNEAAVFGA